MLRRTNDRFSAKPQVSDLCFQSQIHANISPTKSVREAPRMVSDAKMLKADRWSQLWLGLVCMILIANLQYAWTLFVNPMHQAHGWGIAAIQVAFSIFIATETWLTPVEGWLVDALGPRRGPPVMVELWRHHGRGGVGDRCLCEFARHALCRRSTVRHRRRRDLRHLRRQRSEMVSGPARPRRGHHRRRVRRRRGADRDPDPPAHRKRWLQQRLLLVRPGPGRHPAADRADHARANAGRDAANGARQGAAIGDQLPAQPRCWPRRHSGCSTSCSC